MGVVQISEDPDDLWGVASRLIYDIIAFSIGTVGQKEYLLNFRNQFDHGYNSIELFELQTHELIEFRELVCVYHSSGAYEDLGFGKEFADKAFADFLLRVDRLLERRKLN